MAAVAVICSLVAFLAGYYVGRAHQTKSRARNRRSVPRTAIRLVALVAVTRVQRSLQRKLATDWSASVTTPVTVAKRLTAIARSV